MKTSLHVTLGVAAGLINCIAWYTLSNLFTYYEVARVDRYRMLITVVLLITGVFLSIFLSRKKNKGILEFKTAFKTGIVYVIMLALILAIFNYIYYKFIAPDAIDFYISEAKKQVLDNKAKIEDMPKFEEAVRSYFSSFKMFMSTVMIGVIISLVAAGLLHKKSKPIPFREN